VIERAFHLEFEWRHLAEKDTQNVVVMHYGVVFVAEIAKGGVNQLELFLNVLLLMPSEMQYFSMPVPALFLLLFDLLLLLLLLSTTVRVNFYSLLDYSGELRCHQKRVVILSRLFLVGYRRRSYRRGILLSKHLRENRFVACPALLG
jgi:hypothetical protein